MRYIIIGAGAVGGTIGGLLALAGHEVVLTARGTHDVPTPVNETLQQLANRAAAHRLPPGSLSPDKILTAAGAGGTRG